MPVGRNGRPSNLACNRRSAVAVALTRAFAKHAMQRTLPNICACPLYVSLEIRGKNETTRFTRKTKNESVVAYIRSLATDLKAL